MQPATIRLKEVLRRMDSSAEEFSIAYVKYNKRQKTGGDIARFERCICTGTRAKGTRQEKSRQTLVKPQVEAKKQARNPNHFVNATRNLQVLPSFVIRKLHIWLIIEFNGIKVIL